MKRRLLRDGVDILADHIQFDVISRVFLVALREEVTRIAFGHVECRQVGMTVHSINSNTRAPVRRFDHERILCLWNLLEKTRMSDEVRAWDGEPLRMGECRGDGLWHRVASILLLNDEAQTHLPPCLARFADHLQLRFPLQGSGYSSHAGNSGVTRQLCGHAGRLRNEGYV